MQNQRGIAVLSSVALILSASFSPGTYSLAWAAPSSASSRAFPEEAAIPKTPSAPPALPSRTAVETFRCQRYFVHQGKRIDCDSNIRLDGEKLRPIIQDVPAAISELNTYQKNRLQVRTAGYIGTLGLVILAAGALASGSFRDPANNNQLNSTGKTLLRIGLIGGGGLAAGSFLYAVSFINNNEAHLGNAVRFYNEAHPQTPIELQFTTGISF